MAMCIKNDGSVAVAIGDGSSGQFTAIQIAISQQCPGVTNVSLCYVDCKGSYGGSGAYWSWKQCNLQSGAYVCDGTVLYVCILGKDPNYPFNVSPTPPTPTYSPVVQSNFNPPQSNPQSNTSQSNNCSSGSTCINNNYNRSQANKIDVKILVIEISSISNLSEEVSNPITISSPYQKILNSTSMRHKIKNPLT
ncbi:7774_t:CDS:2 [Dentiscutata erythropus]|uniref:7774_t:CDS:1 n=1 Tax=Dentiscutata erythropus TaxID=1348616 RepID=A0A9N8V755_9GLOM|nr:7774_t:CDS:2 [Dentiscutata erythropus]